MTGTPRFLDTTRLEKLFKGILSVRDVASACNVTEATIYQWIRDQGLPSTQIPGTGRNGAKYMIRVDELVSWNNERRAYYEGKGSK